MTNRAEDAAELPSNSPQNADNAQALLAAVVESSQDAIVSKTLDGIILSWNSGAERLFGYTPQEAIGQHITLIIPDDRKNEERDILARIARGERVEHFETVRVSKHGRRIDISLTVSPVRDRAGRIIGASKVARDITDRKRVEEALREADRRKDQFIALLAHELRNPLAPLRNGLQAMLLAAGDAVVVKDAGGMMERQLGHMVQLIDDLLDISRIKQNKMILRRAHVQLAEVVQSAVETVRPMIDEAGHKLFVSLPQEAVYLDADAVRLAQVFSNLLANSAKYTERSGQIWLDAEMKGKEVTVRVRDSGIGIPDATLPRIFDMYSQGDRNAEMYSGGLGIGLALVKGIVEMHGGTVVAASDGPGKGSTFMVNLPVTLGASPSPAAAQARTSGPALAVSRRRILVVDDNRDAAATMALLLKLRGHEVRAAHDGVEAISTAEKFDAEVILMDVDMPRLSGYEATRRIRQQPWGRSVIVIALTGWGHPEDKLKSHEAGCNGHLVKPVDLADLEELIKELFDNIR